MIKKLSSRERLYAGIFVVALIWGAWNYRGMFSSEPPAPPPSPAASATPVIAAGTPVARIATPVVTADYVAPAWSTDPFNRAWRFSEAKIQETKRPRLAPLNLSAVVIRPDTRYAVINGKIVREGQMIAGRRVSSIEESRVRVDENGVEVTLTL